MDGERGVHEVWARALWIVLDIAVDCGISVESLCAGVGFDAAGARRLRRIDWVDYCTVVERFEQLAGGPEACDRLVFASYHANVPETRAAASAFVGPKVLLRLLVEVANPIVFTPVEHRYEDLGGDRVRVVTRLRPHARPCVTFFRGSIAAFAALPRQVGLPAAEVLLADVGDRHGIYELALPPSRTVRARLERAARQRGIVRSVLGYADDGAPITASFGDAPFASDLDERLARATSAWELTPRQLDVLERLVEGDANKEIAQRLGCAENTVELHVTQLLRKSGTTSRGQLIARFWASR